MEAHNIFLMIYLLAFQMLDLNAFHLDGVKKDGKNLKSVHSPYEEPFHTTTSTDTISSSPNVSDSKPLSSAKSNADKPHIKITDETKVQDHDKPWPTAKNTVSEKSSNVLKIGSHPKRQSINHPTWHKVLKEPHRFSTFENSGENGLHGFDVVVVDIPSSYSRMRWEKPRENSFATPSLRYAPITRSPSIFDLLLGLDSISENVLTEPAGMGDEVYYQQSSDNPPWNRHLSFDRLLNPTVTQQKAMNGNRFSKDVSLANFFGKSAEPAKNCTCICEERKKFP
ncbi:uncharacterized protein LOC119070340 [Bradysia coprophila]|uniref:uncharacterized protein LOC119070340 n=1 Tax=Bradysia coprophila TaxID=38358 RepID=UPI00187DA229|nr:uncharacterized protein LOC119070340 [Bradysia coprophila]